MKKTLLALFAVFAIGFAAVAQTNAVTTTTCTDETGKSAGSIELTLGGGGIEVDGESELGLDVSLSTNPFEEVPSVWLGVVQGVYWEPSFSGSTDLFADWSQNLWKDTLYANLGWSVGIVYDSEEHNWRTGPELTLQYYTSDNAFIYAGVNYDFVKDGEDGFRYCFGIGLSF